jgi:CO/xanthine dehydrogenase FAD-binding subunit
MPLALQTYSSAADASAALAGDGACYLGGGTLAVRAVNEGDVSITGYVRTTDPALRGIEIEDGRATIGASVTMAEIAGHDGLGVIGRAARAVGGPAIRNMATVGGNLFAPAPYGDFAAALLALDATVHGIGGDRSIGEFLAGREANSGLVTAVSFAVPDDGAFRFLKVSRIRPKGVSVLTIAACLDTDADGTVTRARIALGCMADRPIRAATAEKALEGRTLTADGIAPAVAAIGEGIDPITDPVASGWYRAEVLPVHFRRLMLG